MHRKYKVGNVGFHGQQKYCGSILCWHFDVVKNVTMMEIFSSDLTTFFSFLVNNEPKGGTRGVVVGDVHQSNILLGLEKTTQKIKL